MPTQHNHITTIDPVFRPVLTALSGFVRQLRNEQNTNGDMEDLRALLKTLPLCSEQYGLACKRLANALRYLRSDEVGAAQWELHALEQQLRTRVKAQA